MKPYDNLLSYKLRICVLLDIYPTSLVRPLIIDKYYIYIYIYILHRYNIRAKSACLGWCISSWQEDWICQPDQSMQITKIALIQLYKILKVTKRCMQRLVICSSLVFVVPYKDMRGQYVQITKIWYLCFDFVHSDGRLWKKGDWVDASSMYI